MSSVLFWLLIIGIALLLPTAYAGKIGAPWAPTRKRAIERVFAELDVNATDVVVDLGAGDGKALIMAAKRGAKAVGYELSPIMWVVAWLGTRRFSSSTVKFKNFFRESLPEDTTIVFMFLMPDTLPKISQYLTKQSLPNLQFVLSYAFPFKNIEPLGVIREENCAPVYIYSAKRFKA